MLDDKGTVPSCCNSEMTLLKANTEDSLLEKHKPDVVVHGPEVSVAIGEIFHPMDEDHFIEWVILETNHGFKVTYLHPGKKPVSKFWLENGEKVEAVYSFCNKHGLWVNTVPDEISVTIEEAVFYCC